MAQVPSTVTRVCTSCRRQLFSRLQTRRLISLSSTSTTTTPEHAQPEYEPADNWHGLQWIATKDWIYDRWKPTVTEQPYDR
jgi:hypothetical protein